MHRFSFVGLVPVIAAMGACSLVNAPADVKSGCSKDSDCPATTMLCHKSTCGSDHECKVVPLDDASSCDAGFCTENAACKMGKCEGTARVCPDQDQCNPGSCDEAAKKCVVAPGHEGDACDDQEPCTTGEACHAGQCNGGMPTDCSAMNSDCSMGACTPGVGCQSMAINEKMPCDIQNPCGTGVCAAGLCAITPTLPDGQPCDDGLFCTYNETCQTGVCVAGMGTPCPPDDTCGTWTCDEATLSCTVAAQNEGGICTKSTCYTGTTCMAGVCDGGTGPTIFFQDDFHDNSQGWLLDPEWQIGPARQSFGGDPINTDTGDPYYPDPGVDHTPTADNGVAGVDIGGNEFVADPDPSHPFYYLTSPPFTTAASGQVILGFYRWLNSDFPPYMNNHVEVLDGAGVWQIVYQSTNMTPLDDSSWTYVQYDITAYKSGATQIRFGFDIESFGVFHVGSWNIDDVLVANKSCP